MATLMARECLWVESILSDGSKFTNGISKVDGSVPCACLGQVDNICVQIYPDSWPKLRNRIDEIMLEIKSESEEG